MGARKFLFVVHTAVAVDKFFSREKICAYLNGRVGANILHGQWDPSC